MQTLAIGVDIINNLRIKKSIANEKFLKRIFTNEEITRSKKIKNKINFFSKRFAAKEAFSKALGIGFRNNLNFRDISIINDKYGKPSIRINKKLRKIIESKFKAKKLNILLTLSDEKNHSIAFVILGKKWNLIIFFLLII